MNVTEALKPSDLTAITGIEPWNRLSAPVCEALFSDARLATLASNECLTEEGTRQHGFYLLLRGKFSDGPQTSGSLLSRVNLLDDTLCPHTLRAIEPVQVVALDVVAVRGACRDHGDELARLPGFAAVVRQQRSLSQALRASKVFGDLDEPLLRDLETTVGLATIPGGSHLMREGEPSDSMVIVVGGRLRAYQRVAGEVRGLFEIGPGESAGEVGLILNQSRSAHVVAVRDTTYAQLRADGFQRLLTRHPVSLNKAVARIIFRYAQGAPRPKHHAARSLTVLPLHPGVDAESLARQLSKALASAGAVRLLGPEDGPSIGHGTAAIDRLNELEQGFDYLVYVGESEPNPWTRRAVRQADHVLLLARAGESAGNRPVEQALAGEPGYSVVRKSLVLLHPQGRERPEPVVPWHNDRELELVYPLREGDGAAVERLARLLSDRAVGVVLGGGGARGFAHLGVLRALHERGIPVDLVGGNSMGALLGAQYAAGHALEDILDWTLRFILRGERPALPLVSLVAGQRLRRDLQRRFSGIDVETLWHPYFAVACNLSRARMEVLDQGPLWRAVLASNSPAGMLPPVPYNGDLLVDGALLDNVPVGVMRDKIGLGTVIAVDVDLREELGVDPALTGISGWQVLKQRLSGADQSRRLPGIVDVLTRAGHIGGLARREQQLAQADHYLQPPVSEFPMLGYRRASAIAEVGYRYAREQIGNWAKRPGS